METHFRLLDLPVEVVRIICASLVPTRLPSEYRIYEDQRDARRKLIGLVGLTRTCHVLRAVAAPLLEACCAHYTRHDRWNDAFNSKFEWIPYTQRILEDPRLAGLEAEFTADKYHRFGACQDGDVPLLDRAAVALGVPGKKHPRNFIRAIDWRFFNRNDYRNVHREFRSILLEIILTNLPNLSSVVLPDDFDYRYLREGSLPGLRHAYLRPNSGNPSKYNCWHLPSVKLGNFSKLLGAAGNLETLSVAGCYRCLDYIPLEHISSLNLDHSRLCLVSLTNILSYCRSLRTFKYSSVECWGEEEEAVTPEEAPPGKVVDALRPVRQILEELDIAMPTTTRSPPMTSLKEFRSLRNVRLTQSTLVYYEEDDDLDEQSAKVENSDSESDLEFSLEPTCDEATFINLLPRSIVSFTLERTDLHIMPAILALAKHALAGNLPNLKEVNFNLLTRRTILEIEDDTVPHTGSLGSMPQGGFARRLAEMKRQHKLLFEAVMRQYELALEIFDEAGVVVCDEDIEV